MIILESILLWIVAAFALILIMQYVLKVPYTPEKPELGLRKRSPVGPRPRLLKSNYSAPENRVHAEHVQTASQNAGNHHNGQASIAQLLDPSVKVAPNKVLQTQPNNSVSAAASNITASSENPGPVSISSPAKVMKNEAKKQTKTMQLMLDKAMSERR